MPKLSTFLWFDNQAEEAMNFYCSIFPNSRAGAVSRYPESMGGGVLTADFEIEGYHITALNGGPQFQPSEAFSIYVETRDQEETDRYWNALLADGGEESMCGWLKDKFGVSWQIIPEALPRLMQDEDRARAARVSEAMLKMRKIIVADLEKAAAA
ncbi:MAG TPA: VOC family protein [Alphaproteobacteria bacterium]|nr:VOC family protein [Alphaproteobacteria bacterium]